MSQEVIPIARIAQSIFLLRGQKVMLGQDLAALYGVTVGALTQAVKRNADRFPKDFVFQLTVEELANLKSQIVISSWGGLRSSEAIRQLMAPSEKTRREIGFHVREKTPRYRTRNSK